MLFILLLVLCSIYVDGAREGDICSQDDVTGVCTALSKCPSAIHDIKNRKTPQTCAFNKEPVVCCLGSVSSIPERQAAAIIADDHDKKCEPISPSMTANKTGQKAWDKCIEYQQLVYPCVSSVSGEAVREDKCRHGDFAVTVGGAHVGRHEFPHAALLGYGALEKLDWLCGGALISERYILTAAHCLSSREAGPVTYAALHTIDRGDVEPEHMHKVKSLITYPEYRPSKRYHDVALLELENPVPLDSFTVPACLSVGELEVERGIATSWNTNDVLDSKTTVLQKIMLTKASTAECLKVYPENRRGGYNETTQICFGDRTLSKEICQDDGGSPLLVKNSKLSCMYSIIGITSYGRGCLAHSPGVYTKVDYYVPWIESIVWN